MSAHYPESETLYAAVSLENLVPRCTIRSHGDGRWCRTLFISLPIVQRSWSMPIRMAVTYS